MGCSRGRQVRDTEHTNNTSPNSLQRLHYCIKENYILTNKKIQMFDLKHKISKQSSPLSFNKWRPAIQFPSRFKLIRCLRYSGICYCVVGWMVPDVLQAVRSFKTTAITHPLTQSHISKNLELQKHCCENYKSCFK